MNWKLISSIKTWSTSACCAYLCTTIYDFYVLNWKCYINIVHNLMSMFRLIHHVKKNSTVHLFCRSRILLFIVYHVQVGILLFSVWFCINFCKILQIQILIFLYIICETVRSGIKLGYYLKLVYHFSIYLENVVWHFISVCQKLHFQLRTEFLLIFATRCKRNWCGATS